MVHPGRLEEQTEADVGKVQHTERVSDRATIEVHDRSQRLLGQVDRCERLGRRVPTGWLAERPPHTSSQSGRYAVQGEDVFVPAEARIDGGSQPWIHRSTLVHDPLSGAQPICSAKAT